MLFRSRVLVLVPQRERQLHDGLPVELFRLVVERVHDCGVLAAQVPAGPHDACLREPALGDGKVHPKQIGTVIGNTAGAAQKDALLENGLTVKVPLFIKTSEVIRVDTRSGEYVERAK